MLIPLCAVSFQELPPGGNGEVRPKLSEHKLRIDHGGRPRPTLGSLVPFSRFASFADLNHRITAALTLSQEGHPVTHATSALDDPALAGVTTVAMSLREVDLEQGGQGLSLLHNQLLSGNEERTVVVSSNWVAGGIRPGHSQATVC